MRYKILFRLFLAIYFLLLTTSSYATTWYVDATDGNNSNDGKTPATALKTLSAISDTILSPGDSVLFQRGEIWTGNNEFLYIKQSGTAGNYIVIGDYGTGAKPIFEQAAGDTSRGILLGSWSPSRNIRYVKIMNIEVRNFVQQGIMGADADTGVQYIIVDSCYSHNNVSDGIMLACDAGKEEYAGQHLIINCQSDSNGSHGFKVYGKNNAIINCTGAYNGQIINYTSGLQMPTEGTGIDTVRNCTFHHNAENGIRIARNYGGAIIDSCLCYNNDYGIQVTEYTHDIIISNSTCRDDSNYGIWVRTRSGNVTIKNCSLYNSLGAGICAENGITDLWIKNNKIFNNTDEGIKIYAGGIGGGEPDSVRIIGNYIWDNGDEGILIDSCDVAIVMNNTLFANDSVGSTYNDISLSSKADSIWVYNNILGLAKYNNSISSFWEDYNLYHRNIGGDIIDSSGTKRTLTEWRDGTNNGDNSINNYHAFKDTVLGSEDFTFDSTFISVIDSGGYTITTLTAGTNSDTIKVSGFPYFIEGDTVIIDGDSGDVYLVLTWTGSGISASSKRDSLSVLTLGADGRSWEQQTDTTWSYLVGASGNNVITDGKSEGPIMMAGTISNKWNRIYRIIMNFNGKVIPTDANVDTAFLYLRGSLKEDGLSATPAVSMYSATLGNDILLQAGDYNGVGNVALTDTISYASWSVTGYNKFTLNQHGLDHIDSCITATDSTTAFAMRTPDYDVANSAPNWVSGVYSRCSFFMADSAGKEPYLITYYSISGATGADTTIIVLSNTANWSANDNVSLPYSGNAPDIGAYEYISPAAGDGVEILTGRISEINKGIRKKDIDKGERQPKVRAQ